MRAVIQRVSSGSVAVDGATVGSIGAGFVVLVGAMDGDDEPDAAALASKVAGLRVFRDSDGQMNRSLTDVGGSVLVISQFTLAADVRKGRRPSFARAARRETAAPLVESVCHHLEAAGLVVERGVFGADMEVSLVNDGPVTIVIDTLDGMIV